MVFAIIRNMSREHVSVSVSQGQAQLPSSHSVASLKPWDDVTSQ